MSTPLLFPGGSTLDFARLRSTATDNHVLLLPVHWNSPGTKTVIPSPIAHTVPTRFPSTEFVANDLSLLRFSYRLASRKDRSRFSLTSGARESYPRKHR